MVTKIFFIFSRNGFVFDMKLLTATGSIYILAGLINEWRILDSDVPFNDLSNKDENENEPSC